MPPSRELLDENFRQKIEQARRMTPAERVLEGLRESDVAARVMADGVRQQFPSASEDQVQRVLRERVDRLRRLRGRREHRRSRIPDDLMVLQRAKIEYSLVGSLTSMYYGITRTTMDADFVVHLAAARAVDLMNQLPPELAMDGQPRFELLTGKTYHFVAVVGTPFNVDLFALSNDPFDLSSFSRRRTIRLLDHDARAPLPRMSSFKLRRQRPQDVIDAQDVLAVQGESLDWLHRGWCGHTARELLEKLRARFRRVVAGTSANSLGCYFSPATNRCRRASSIVRSLPKMSVKSFSRCGAR